eukprot:CAMPEP_0201673274 /NCGR_PEP_ID=MMETSP0494-20130426/34267_1 /ASSEMBLY_ACC=CAM_ASM_000839 /TAXON_ID=420259 /ORGANISM="Thalassiosira gravida, Strain GMp14c1" /LENGTH=227 /DNA_ID=CAMNT_0048155147 /DNA_START=59 /DNA_END=739 /DNA_ORIENTATION=-
MMASRSAASYVLLHVSIILLILHNDKVTAWQIGSTGNGKRVSARKTNTVGTTTAVSHHNPSDDGHPEITSSPRRELLLLIPKMATATTIATATVMMPHQQALAAGGMTADSARDQWKNASPALDELLQNWSTEKWSEGVGGGDIIRTKLGTMGDATTSPLFQIEKALKAVGDSDYVDDFIEWTETGEEFMDSLYQADSLANSSNLKTGSGKQTPPEVFIEQSRKEVV